MKASQQLDAYFARIGIDRPDRTDLPALAAVQRAHRFAIPFENLDIPLGLDIDLTSDALFDKLVTRRRGGYCFEQNGLFLRVLRTIGFEARPLLARVWLMTDETPPRTHTLNLVRLDGADWTVDVGFGGSFAPPLPLVHDRPVATPDGVRHRLVEDPVHGWMLERDGGPGWARQYSFTLEEVWPVDLEMGNHWTSTRPDTRFTTLRIASRPLADGYASLVDRTLTVNRMSKPEVREVADADEYRRTLKEIFDLELDADEVAALKLF